MKIDRKILSGYDECGIYKPSHGGLSRDYACLDKSHLLQQVESSDTNEEAIASVTALRDMASEQATWKSVPRNVGFPILRGPAPEPIETTRSYIENTRDLCNDILEILSAE